MGYFFTEYRKPPRRNRGSRARALPAGSPSSASRRARPSRAAAEACHSHFCSAPPARITPPTPRLFRLPPPPCPPSGRNCTTPICCARVAPLHARARARRPPPPPLRASRRARSAAPSQRSSSARRATPPPSAKRPPRPSALSCRRHMHSRRRGGLRRAGCRGRSLRTRRRLRCSSCRHRLLCAVIASSSVATRHSPLLLAATSSAQRRPGHGRCCAEEAATRRRHGTPPPHGQCAAIGCDQQLASLRAGGLESRPAGRVAGWGRGVTEKAPRIK